MNNNQPTADTAADEATTATPADTTTDTSTTDTTTKTTDSATTDAETDTALTTGTEDAKITSMANAVIIEGITVTTTEPFSVSNSTLTIATGDTFTVKDLASANITLSSNRITNNDPTSAFLRGTNSTITLTLDAQIAEGDIVLDGLSTLSLVLSDSSFYMGTINGGNTAKSVSVDLDATSQLILAGNTYLTALKNADPANMNIYGNGYKLYVAGQEVAVNGSEIPEVPETVIDESEVTEAETVEPSFTPPAPATKTTDYTPFIVGGVAILVIILAVLAIFIHNKKKTQLPPTPPTVPPENPFHPANGGPGIDIPEGGFGGPSMV